MEIQYLKAKNFRENLKTILDICDDKMNLNQYNENFIRPMKIEPEISLSLDGNILTVSRDSDERRSKSLHGLTRTLINNMISGVQNEFTRELQINGVGYRVQKQGNDLNLSLGYSHPVIFAAPAGITFDVPNANTIIVKGIDKELVGQTAAVIRTKRPPEVYRGKGIKYAEEVIRRKVGKTGK